MCEAARRGAEAGIGPATSNRTQGDKWNEQEAASEAASGLFLSISDGPSTTELDPRDDLSSQADSGHKLTWRLK